MDAANTHTHERTFSLGQLLLAIVAVLLLMTLVVPRFERGAVHADEAEAIQSLKTLNQMEGQYSASYPTRGFACSLAQLGGNPKAGPPSPDAAQLIPEDLARGSKAGYLYTFTSCTPGQATDHKAYRITAVPQKIGTTGDRGFCTDETGEISYDAAGGTNCRDRLR